MTKEQILEATKLACRIFSDSLDDEISSLIDSAFFDLEQGGVTDISGVPYTALTADQLVVTAVKTYVKLNLGDLITDTDYWEKLKSSYDEQKAQLKMRKWSSSDIEEES